MPKMPKMPKKLAAVFGECTVRYKNYSPAGKRAIFPGCVPVVASPLLARGKMYCINLPTTFSNRGIGAGEPLLSLAAVVHMTGESPAAIYVRMQEGTFPKPLRIGHRRAAWTAGAIRKWMAVQNSILSGQRDDSNSQ